MDSVSSRISFPGFWGSSSNAPSAAKLSGGASEPGFLLCLLRNIIVVAVHIHYNLQYQEVNMKRVLITLLLVAIFCISATSTVFAGGDKVRGDNGQGSVNQVQVQDPPPFQP